MGDLSAAVRAASLVRLAMTYSAGSEGLEHLAADPQAARERQGGRESQSLKFRRPRNSTVTRCGRLNWQLCDGISVWSREMPSAMR
jgi:hypothetical protein